MAALVQVTAWERVSLWRRIPFAFARVFLLIAFLTMLLKVVGPPVMLFASSRWIGRNAPAAKVVPVPLTDYSVSRTPATPLSYCGFDFQVPWRAPNQVKLFANNKTVVLVFDTGQSLMLWVNPENEGFLTEIVQDKSLGKGLRTVFGDLLDLSPYDQYSTLVNITPSSIRAFGPRSEAVRGMTLLALKPIALPASLQTGAFSFELSDKRGFQFGDPQKSKAVSFKVFGREGYILEVFFGSKQDLKLTQPELNTILRSLHPATGTQSR